MLPFPSEPALVPGVSVEHLMALAHHLGIESVLRAPADELERDFKRWEFFDKTARVAGHADVEMYIDPKSGAMKRNAIGKETPESARRPAIKNTKRLQMNFDMHSMTKEQAHGLLPTEFDVWRNPHYVPWNANEANRRMRATRVQGRPLRNAAAILVPPVRFRCKTPAFGCITRIRSRNRSSGGDARRLSKGPFAMQWTTRRACLDSLPERPATAQTLPGVRLRTPGIMKRDLL